MLRAIEAITKLSSCARNAGSSEETNSAASSSLTLAEVARGWLTGRSSVAFCSSASRAFWRSARAAVSGAIGAPGWSSRSAPRSRTVAAVSFTALVAAASVGARATGCAWVRMPSIQVISSTRRTMARAAVPSPVGR